MHLTEMPDKLRILHENFRYFMMAPRIQIRFTVRKRRTEREDNERQGNTDRHFYIMGNVEKNITSSQGSQSTPALPSDRSNMNTKM
jgi:hypothetical protein